MSKAEIATELAKLPHEDRRAIARLIFEMEEDGQILRECDQRANDRFLMLDMGLASYAWSAKQGTPEEKFTAVLEIPPVESPETAVRVSIEAAAKK